MTLREINSYRPPLGFFINPDYVRVVRTRITATTQCTLDVIDRDIGWRFFRPDFANNPNESTYDGKLSRDNTRSEPSEEKSSVLTSKSDRSTSSSNHLIDQMRPREKEIGRRKLHRDPRRLRMRLKTRREDRDR